MTVAPEQYLRWRGSVLGWVTDRIEIALVLALAGPLARKRVLDVGCGDGVLAVAAAMRGAQVTGVDTSLQMLDAAKGRAAAQGVAIRLQQADACGLPFPDRSFDIIFAMASLCMVGDAQAAVREMTRVLAPSGTLVIGDLGRFSLWAVWRRLRGLLGSSTWGAVRFWSARELSTLVGSAGLVSGRVQGAIYYPPIGIAARLLGPVESFLGSLTTLGAAFLAVAATKPAQGAASHTVHAAQDSAVRPPASRSVASELR